MPKKYTGFRAKEIVDCSWVEFNSRIMDSNTSRKELEKALQLEQNSETIRTTFVNRLKLRIGQLAKEEAHSNM